MTNNPRYAHLVGDRFLLLAARPGGRQRSRGRTSTPSDLMRLMAGGEEFSALTSALTELHPELGDR